MTGMERGKKIVQISIVGIAVNIVLIAGLTSFKESFDRICQWRD